jgi:hypothetical protein
MPACLLIGADRVQIGCACVRCAALSALSANVWRVHDLCGG